MASLVQLRASSSDVRPLDIATGKDILQAIQQQAEKKWGDRWKANLVREYVEIVKARGFESDKNATPVNRRPQIDRAFDTGRCNIDTAIALATAVGCRFQMSCTEVKVQTF